MPSFIRVMRYDFDTVEDMRTFIDSGLGAVPLNGSTEFGRDGKSRKIHSKTMLVEDVTVQEIAQSVTQEVVDRADLVVAVDAEGDIHIVKHVPPKPDWSLT
jgi:hypothetical protein